MFTMKEILPLHGYPPGVLYIARVEWRIAAILTSLKIFLPLSMQAWPPLDRGMYNANSNKE
jgi:hypothetical protein